jgi:hypothetical protein
VTITTSPERTPSTLMAFATTGLPGISRSAQKAHARRDHHRRQPLTHPDCAFPHLTMADSEALTDSDRDSRHIATRKNLHLRRRR